MQKDTDSPWYLVGLVSFGAKVRVSEKEKETETEKEKEKKKEKGNETETLQVCGSGRPGVYTRTSHFLPWIQEQMDALI
jgi:hypothetical protein